ncbi:MAG TPA: hypothetical protein VFA77_09680 [Candidatus Eisenbacteria bacterium]|jgi:hypothetical protein|nr:hypothetical protein [Candidatus Eisenbacteria bacterium]
MNAADQAIEEIREVRRRISAEFDHDINKYFAYLREMEKQYPEQIRRGKELLAQRDEERKKYPETTSEPLAVRDKPKP